MSSPSPAIAPYVPTYAVRVPYLTRAEFLAAPTGVDLSQLVPGGDEAANGAALDRLIGRASGYANVICRKILAATTDVQVGVYRVRRDGTIRVPVDYTPLIEVTAVLTGWAPNKLTPLSDLSGLWIQRKTVRIPVTGTIGCDQFTQVTYVNGYANTALAADAASGVSQVTVDSPLGVFPGLTLTVLDDALDTTEMVTVDQSYVQGSTTVPLIAPLAAAHTAGTAVSALPPEIKQATISLTAHLIKTRGAEALALESATGGPSKVEKESPGYTDEYEQAVDLLGPHRRAA